jgi:hypothetical protein
MQFGDDYCRARITFQDCISYDSLTFVWKRIRANTCTCKFEYKFCICVSSCRFHDRLQWFISHRQRTILLLTNISTKYRNTVVYLLMIYHCTKLECRYHGLTLSEYVKNIHTRTHAHTHAHILADFIVYVVVKSKAIPLHAMEAHGGRGGIAPTHS